MNDLLLGHLSFNREPTIRERNRDEIGEGEKDSDLIDLSNSDQEDGLDSRQKL